MKKWSKKNLAVFCVGGSPIENPEIETVKNSWFMEENAENVNTFYCPGGFDYEKMSVPSKVAMKMFLRVLKAKKDKSEEEKIMVEMISKSYDISDKKYIAPIIEWANSVRAANGEMNK